MSNPEVKKDKEPERDELELEPEMVKDLDVSDDQIGQVRGGCSGSGTLSLAAIGTRSTAA